ncbi:hypothetical protein PROFUN_08533 [Planoprotostelium fungivorum]|uniref:Uncharacterized protein n=1 Tax=Planoprotostelium fungivorum TaxID=1890364 RepID=A0A2P6N1N8_9EUKA|nr:hypothetical protein PROFUN_08533 [Planoprotostelium fungivorum]
MMQVEPEDVLVSTRQKTRHSITVYHVGRIYMQEWQPKPPTAAIIVRKSEKQIQKEMESIRRLVTGGSWINEMEYDGREKTRALEAIMQPKRLE